MIISVILLAVLGDARLVAQCAVLRLPARAQAARARHRPPRCPAAGAMNVAGRAVDDDGVAGFDKAGGVLDLARPTECPARARRWRHAMSARLPPAPGRASACGRSRAAPPAPSSAPRGWRSPAAAPWRRMILAHQAGASAGWRGHRDRAAARADRGRSCAACARACRTARARPPPRR